MLWNLLALTAALTCVSAVTTVTQRPDVLTVRRGETASMDCNLGTVTDQSARWYKQIPGAAPKYVLKFRHDFSNVEYGPGFSAPKFTSNHQSKSDYRLIINNVDGVDSAVYYCKTWDDSSGVTVVFGQGTKLIVTDVAPAPVLTVLPPSLTQLQSSRVSLLCVSHQRGPFAQVTWLVDGTPVNSGVWSSSAVQQPDQSFYMSSSLCPSTRPTGAPIRCTHVGCLWAPTAQRGTSANASVEKSLSSPISVLILY
ncbi:immunoglobulin kappa light chain-like [Boleophthalmus pectinirostris]|uniref:immunoglobulin kappa light chain-like n=1 Tax=Boleophthalmus pectinirostris TaxID=150288 RepID=UPI00242D6A04|nr:immunoglobulin kappa light chain-like [Boleophthalmus pectinirostris]